MKSSAYNAHGSHARSIVSENTFAHGMKYTDNPLPEGYVKTLINFQLTNDGTTIKPRLGYEQVATNIAEFTIDEQSQDFCVYLTDNLLVSTADESDAVLCRAVLSGAIDVLDTYAQAAGRALQLFNLANAHVTISYKGKYITGDNQVYTHFAPSGTDDKYYLAMQTCNTSIHECDLVIAHSRNGVRTVMDSCAYVPVIHTYTKDGVMRTERHLALLRMKFNEDSTSFVWWFDLIQPRDITAIQAVNYGYNMLQATPYKFENQSTANAIILLDGLLPYDRNHKLLTSARTGAEILFHLVYRYPEADLTNGKKYRVRWSIQDLDSDAAPTVLQDYLEGQEYTPGDDIFICTSQTTYKRFTLIANVCYADEVSIDNPEPKPLGTLTLAYYYLTNDNSTSTLNADAVNYDLGTAQGMCTWQQRLVLWGVANAKNVLWISEVNDPSWFPYPNNCEIFPDDIVACVRYKTSLLVFTRSALYQIALQDDGLSYSTTCMQERLTMEESDISSIIPVQNMVFFKNGNAYFMIVPVSSSFSGELQLAPISRPIELMFTDFKNTVIGLLESVVQPTSYNYYIVNEDGARMTDDEYHPICVKQLEDETLESLLYDWWCMLENRTLRIYYKFQMCVGKSKITYIDLIFNYDTVTRAWTMSIVNSTRFRVTHYISSVTAETIFAQPTLVDKNKVSVNLIQGNEEFTFDSFDLDYDQTGWNETLQYLDTGFRDLDPDIKKRFRQVQFRVNNPFSDTLKFYTSFAVDNDLRKHYSKFNTTEITDPDADDYGYVYVDAEMADPDIAWGGSEQHDYVTQWELDVSRFPNAHTAQVRFNVSGKGNLCRFEIRSYNAKIYEISSVAWVYRPMYAR